ncbi:MAG: hypothetical protein JWQ93_664 [Marmoricola sp.]|nr:hypothetical protein [Marmoricola sp.]
MTRARWTTHALGAVLVAASVAAGPLVALTAVAGPAEARVHAAVPAADEAETTPLSVELTSMTPSQIPSKGVITLTGVVRNDSTEDWLDINVAPFLSRTPITTRDELARAAATPANEAVGERLTDSGTYAAVGDLTPGRAVPFSLRVPVTSLLISGDPGVYWIGVHALGTDAAGRDLVADGRARTFIPLVAPRQARTRSVAVSVVLPLRERARRAADGSLNGPTRWVTLTAPDGRLTRLVDFGASAGRAPVSWLVDPAVLDALDDFSRGNPPLSLRSAQRAGNGSGGADNGDPTGDSGGDSGGQPSGSPSPTDSASPEPGSPSEEQRQRARSVLDAFLGTARSHPLFTLGYSDPDVAALARHRPSLINRSDALAEKQMSARGLRGPKIVAPPSGYFDPRLLGEVPRDSTLLLSDAGRLSDPPLSRLPSGQEMVMSDARASTGGPAPADPRDPLALRQRILSEAALEVAKGAAPTRPIVVSVPGSWDPGANWRQADFFGGLQVPWVRMASMPRGASTTYGGQLVHGRAQLALEIRGSNVSATRTLIRTSDVLRHLLTTPNEATDRLVGAALQASSYSARPTPDLAARQVLALDDTVRGRMAKVQVTGTDFVTLSGGSGSLTVTLVNGLGLPITVGLKARTDPQVKVETPDPVDMQPGQRTTLRLQVTSGVGVHDVTIYPVTHEGEETGTPLTFSLRTSQVGRLIWYIISAGGALLAVMTVRRVVLRIRSNRWRREAT